VLFECTLSDVKFDFNGTVLCLSVPLTPTNDGTSLTGKYTSISCVTRATAIVTVIESGTCKGVAEVSGRV